MGVSDLSTCTTHSHHTGLKVARTLKPEKCVGGQGAARSTVGPGQRGPGDLRPPEAHAFKLF